MSSPNPIVIANQDHVFTTSLLVAEKFNKNHRDVLKAIRNQDVFTKLNELNFAPVEEFTKRNFALSNYTDSTGRSLPMYELTRDGFMMLAMGFTGKEAALWKIAFINAFNRMEAKLNELLVTEHHSMLADLYAKHPKWRQVVLDTQASLPQALIGQFNGMNIRNVQRMQQRIRKAGIFCQRSSSQGRMQ